MNNRDKRQTFYILIDIKFLLITKISLHIFNFSYNGCKVWDVNDCFRTSSSKKKDFYQLLNETCYKHDLLKCYVPWRDVYLKRLTSW